jgi:peptidoglycan LD-endopeptidase LytH
MARISRVLLTFGIGALSMLLVVIAFDRYAPRAPGMVPGPENSVPSSPSAPADRATSPGNRAAASASARAPVTVSGTTSRLLIPVAGVAAASLVDTYEDARGEGRRHDAIDIMAPRGTPVLAADDGVVMKLFQSDLGGTTLYQLAPDRRTIYYYAHLDRYAPDMAEGRVLRRGEVLGYVGNTGSAESGNYHLHFEVSTTEDPARYWGGVPQNPYPLLK